LKGKIQSIDLEKLECRQDFGHFFMHVRREIAPQDVAGPIASGVGEVICKFC